MLSETEADNFSATYSVWKLECVLLTALFAQIEKDLLLLLLFFYFKVKQFLGWKILNFCLFKLFKTSLHMTTDFSLPLT